MADASILTYKQLQDAVLEKRFPESARQSAMQWLAVAYQDVWNASDWSFKRVSRASFYTTADGTSTGSPAAQPLAPSAFAQPTGLIDQNDNTLTFVSPDDFERRYTDTAAPAYGTPQVFTVINRQIVLWPTPDAAYQLQLSYRRRLAHKDSAGNVVAGFMTADDDTPLWDDHHRILVPRAQAIGLKEKNDPTWPPLQDEFDRQIETMTLDYVQDYPALWGSETASVW